MKRLTLLTCAALMFAACQQHQPAAATTAKTDSVRPEPSLKGLYKSTDFSDEPLYIYINFQNAFHVAGYDQHKGLRRNLSGDVVKTDAGWKLTLHEPGDNAFDGTFLIHMDTSTLKGSGTWTPVNKTALKTHQFTLTGVGDSQHNGHVFYGYEGDHCDVTFDPDGSVELNYYPKINDSTFVQQMITLRGNYEQKDSTVYLHWRNQPEGRRALDTLYVHYDGEGADRYITEVTNKEFNFSGME